MVLESLRKVYNGYKDVFIFSNFNEWDVKVIINVFHEFLIIIIVIIIFKRY